MSLAAFAANPQIVGRGPGRGRGRGKTSVNLINPRLPEKIVNKIIRVHVEVHVHVAESGLRLEKESRDRGRLDLECRRFDGIGPRIGFSKAQNR